MDERRNHLDLQIDLLTEQENTKMLTLLKQIAEKHGIDRTATRASPSLSRQPALKKLIEQIDAA
jgi:uncharacterized membrane protein